MNKKQQELLDEVYENFVNIVDEKWQKSDVGDLDDFIYDGLLIDGYDDNGKWFARIPTQEEFIQACKIYTEFSEKWGLTIKERELSWEERRDLLTPEQYDGTILENGQRTGFGYISPFTDKVIHYWMNLHNIPTKLITITYNDKTIESYEMDGKLCYCGNPVDTSNPDCVTFNLCKEHQMDT